MNRRGWASFIAIIGCLVLVPGHATLAGAQDDAAVDEKDVAVLTRANLTEIVQQHSYVVADVYAPWCGWSKKMAPHFAEAATQLKSLGADLVAAKVDGDAYDDWQLISSWGVTGYPTLVLFVDGHFSESLVGYRETPDEIVTWVKDRVTLPAAASLTSAATATSRKLLRPANGSPGAYTPVSWSR